MSPLVISAIIAGVVGLTSTIVSTVASKEQSDANIQAQKDFNESQSLSAKIAEAKQNGISPLAVLGQNASNSVVSAPQANADYSGLSNFGNSMLSMLGGLGKQASSERSSEKISASRNLTDKEIAKISADNAKSIADMQINSNEKMQLKELNNALTIANNRNATDLEIQKSVREANHNLEILRSSNSEFNQQKLNEFNASEHAKQMKNAMDMLEKQLEQAEKQRSTELKKQWIHEAFTTFNTVVYSAATVFGGNVSAYVDNLGKSSIGF